MSSTPARKDSVEESLKKAGRKALGGGITGAAAMAVQVFTLMPLRTVMNYQYRHGTTMGVAIKTLKDAGGFKRFYSGLGPALIQAPLSRFGDTASNAGALALMDSFEQTASLPAFVKTAGASVLAGAFRILLVPVDTVKTIMQVEGKAGLPALAAKIRTHGPTAAFHGALASAAATALGHYPWFAVYNTLQEKIPKPDDMWQKLARNAGIGFTSSVVSDTLTNSVRVVKTFKQTSKEAITYKEAVTKVLEKEGWGGLLGRGLKTRLLANGLQGLLFSVLWKGFEDAWNKREKEINAKA